jgi:hypothetical protein
MTGAAIQHAVAPDGARDYRLICAGDAYVAANVNWSLQVET